MRKHIVIVLIALFAISCTNNQKNNIHQNDVQINKQERLYSKQISDSFNLFISLPEDYNPSDTNYYKVVYLLDANIYFDIVSSIIHRYSEIGLAPKVILVGIGYKDFPTLDSLRNRDDTYPIAIPEYQMSVSGGANNFLSFISNELIPHIDKLYKTDTSKRVLMGHSLGGYFCLYTFLQTLKGNNNSFTDFIAASPSIHYNKYYLLTEFKNLLNMQKTNSLKTYISFGGMEDDENKDDSLMRKNQETVSELKKILQTNQQKEIQYKADIFSNLGHMDTPLPTFIKGLQWEFSSDK
jgi:uncharacterized protein